MSWNIKKRESCPNQGEKKVFKKRPRTDPNIGCVRDGQNARMGSGLMLHWEGVTSSDLSPL